MAQPLDDVFVVGLKYAHAMKIQACEVMERQSERLDKYPQVNEEERKTKSIDSNLEKVALVHVAREVSENA